MEYREFMALGGRYLPPADKSIQPGQHEKYLALTFYLGQRVEGRPQVWRSQLGLVPVVEVAQTLLDPIFRTHGVVQVVVEILLLALAVRTRSLRQVRVLLSFSRWIALLFRCQEHAGFGIVQCDQRSHNVPTIQRTQLDVRDCEPAAKDFLEMSAGCSRLCEIAETAKPYDSLVFGGSVKHLVEGKSFSLAHEFSPHGRTHVTVQRGYYVS